MNDYAQRIEHLARKRLTNPTSYVLDVPGRTGPVLQPQFPLSRDEFHKIPDGLAAQVSWNQRDYRVTYRVAYSGHFGWSVVSDRVGGSRGPWYGAVITSPRTYAGCVAYITNCIAPYRYWFGDNLTVDLVV